MNFFKRIFNRFKANHKIINSINDINNESSIFKIEWDHINNPIADKIHKDLTNFIISNGGIINNHGFTGLKVWCQIATSKTIPGAPTNITGFHKKDPTKIYHSAAGFVQFIGFSRIDKCPFFKAYRQENFDITNKNFVFNPKENTFSSISPIGSQIVFIGTNPTIGSNFNIRLIYRLEDHWIPNLINPNISKLRDEKLELLFKKDSIFEYILKKL